MTWLRRRWFTLSPIVSPIPLPAPPPPPLPPPDRAWRQPLQPPTRLLVDVVVPAEVAGVVVRDLRRHRLRRAKFPAGQEIGEELRVGDHLVVAAKLRVLVLEGVEA